MEKERKKERGKEREEEGLLKLIEPKDFTI